MTFFFFFQSIYFYFVFLERVSRQKHLGRVVFVNEIPKNPSGKILRRRLREIAVSLIPKI